MSQTTSFEPIPETRQRRPRCPEPAVSAAARRRRLRHARRVIAAFPPANPYQGQLQDVTLAMIGYMDLHWCGPGHAYDFDRWWRIVDYYARCLGSPELSGPQARETLVQILEQDQIHPAKL